MRVHVRVPATSANLGPGFDTLGLALTLHNELTVEESDHVMVSVHGEGEPELPADDRNLVVQAARLAFAAAGRSFAGLLVDCVNRIPLRRGLGSSSAARLGGLLAANTLLGSPLDRDTILALAARAEGHPDNVAAALLGGVTVACQTEGRIVALSVPAPPDVHWVVLVPAVEATTAEARAVLPTTVAHADAVYNVQRVALLLASLLARRADLLHPALDDRLHQPYRARLFPWMSAVVAAARAAGALGCVLSGAGPALLAAVAEDPDKVGDAMTRSLGEAGVAGVAHVVAVDTAGAVVETR
jgi:homoserine kinase